MTVLAEDCAGCRVCLDVGCPALSFDPEVNKARIDANTCNGCGVCAQVCSWRAIVDRESQHA
jgi:indolepyruvate ferredoxin oxidoreductase alpha subunit